MAEFCSQCTPFKNEFEYNLFKMALKLKKGYSLSFICEGCNNRGIFKDEDGSLYLAIKEKQEINLHPVKIEDLMFVG